MSSNVSPNASLPRRAALAGATCLLILGGMIVGHAWPLWTGRTIVMKVMPVDPRDLFRGEYVRLDASANRLYRDGSIASSPSLSVVRPVGRVFEESRRGAVVYVQLQSSANGDYVPVSASREPVDGALNLRGRVRYPNPPNSLTLDYGLDAFYMQEGKARPIEDAIRRGRNVQMEVAVASSGQARIRALLLDGVRVGR
jgi:uncharacterized membrane-anchored protein